MPLGIIPNYDSIGRQKTQSLIDQNYDRLYRQKYPEGVNLNPTSDFHTKLMGRLLEFAAVGRDAVQNRYESWNHMDELNTAYIPVSAAEELVKSKDRRNPISIMIPITYATRQTLIAYMSAAFLNPPIFRYENQEDGDILGSAMLERIVQFHVHRFRVALNLRTLWSDGFMYNFGVAIPMWERKYGYRKVRSSMYQSDTDIPYGLFSPSMGSVYEEIVPDLLYEGNSLKNIDPYQVLYDNTVPIYELQNGTFFGFTERSNYVSVLEEENDDEEMFNCRYLKHMDARSVLMEEKPSKRDLFDINGVVHDLTRPVDRTYMYVKLIPSEWELGSGDVPEIWYFQWAGDSVILKARPLGLWHNMFPAVVCSPDYDGHSSGAPSVLEQIQGMQTAINFLWNSHVANVRRAINDLLVVDPQVVNINDLTDPWNGFMVRLRRTFWGKGKISEGITQLKVTDITANHIGDMANLMPYIEQATGTPDQLKGQRRQTSERVSATEASNVQSSALSRMEDVARVISQMTMAPLGYFFASHAQQFMTKEQYVKITGSYEDKLRQIFGDAEKIMATPDMINIPYDVIEHDGTIPGAGNPQLLLQAFQMAASNPMIAPAVDLINLYRYILLASGAKNVDRFIKGGNMAGMMNPQVVPNEQVEQGVEQGNLLPINQLREATGVTG